MRDGSCLTQDMGTPSAPRKWGIPDPRSPETRPASVIAASLAGFESARPTTRGGASTSHEHSRALLFRGGVNG